MKNEWEQKYFLERWLICIEKRGILGRLLKVLLMVPFTFIHALFLWYTVPLFYYVRDGEVPQWWKDYESTGYY